MVLTNRGRNLQAKAQAGTQLNFTRFGVGDGELGGSSILELNVLKHQVKSVNISKAKAVTGGKATIGMVLSNQDLVTGFYFREIGLFAQDPDVGEILYCYANAGATADYIPAGGGTDVVEKSFDVIAIVGTAANVTATIDSSLVYASAQDLINHENNSTIHVTQDEKIAWNSKETPEGAQIKVDAVQGALASHLADDMLHNSDVSLYRLNKDVNGVFTELQYKRSDGALFKKSVLSGGTSPKYTTRTVTYYKADGITINATKIYTEVYTGDDLTSEVLQ